MERKINLENEKNIRMSEAIGKILGIVKEYKFTYRETMDIINWLRREIEDTIISEDSLKSN